MAKVISSLSIRVGANAQGVKRGMDQGAKSVKGFATSAESSFGRAAASMAKMAAGALLAFAAIKSLTGSFGEIDRIGKFADEVGFTTEQIGAWRHGAELTGTSVETLEKGLQIFTRRLGEAKNGLGEGVKGFQALGLSAAQLAQMDPAAAFKLVAQAISELPTAADQAAASFALFGRQGQELLTFLNSGAEGITAFERQAKKLGITVSREMAAEVEAANDAMANMKAAAKGLTQQLAVALAPAIKSISEAIQAAILFLASFDKTTLRVVASIAAFAAGLVAAILAVVLIIKAIGGIIAAYKSLSKAMILVKALSGPKGWLSLAAGLAVAAGATAVISKQFKKVETDAGKAAAKVAAVAKAGSKIKTDLVDPAKQATEAMKKAAEETRRWEQIAKKLNDRFKLPFTSMIESIKEAQGALSRGLITWRVYQAAVAAAVNQFEQANEGAKQLRNNLAGARVGAAVRGTAGGVNAVASGTANLKAVADRLQQLKDKAVRRERLLARIENELKLNTRAVKDNAVMVRNHRIR